MKDQLQKFDKGTILGKEDRKTSYGDNFDLTMRNTNHPFFSYGPTMQSFNDQILTKLKNESRFSQTFQDGMGKDQLSTDSVELSNPNSGIRTMKPKQFYDIKGNSFKNTLIPKKTAFSSLIFKGNSPNRAGSQEFKLAKVEPKYNKDIRSGTILFNNINQHNVNHAPHARCQSTLIDASEDKKIVSPY